MRCVESFRLFTCASLIVAASMGMLSAAFAQEREVLIQSTTSTANSGLYDAILPAFEDATGITPRVVSVGTGQALKNARNCDGDVLLVHAKPAEEAFVAEGFGTARYDVMYNDFVIVGPRSDPAQVKGLSPAQALSQIAEAQVLFTSRGDDSGTHVAEKRLWAGAEIDPSAASGTWYRELGAGMGATLNAAVAMEAYVLTDRATWQSFGNPGNHIIFVEGDSTLFNQYGVIALSPEVCPRVAGAEAQAFVDWILGDAGQSAISGFTVGGQQVFFPNAAR